jgi:hypothetical protein
MMTTRTPRVAVVWRGDHEACHTATPANNRFHRVFETLAAVGIHADPRCSTRSSRTSFVDSS